MEIYFSRHAKRRGKLYSISEKAVREILKNKELIKGNQEVVETLRGFKYPIKIVVSVKNDIVTVITNYPFKKGEKK